MAGGPTEWSERRPCGAFAPGPPTARVQSAARTRSGERALGKNDKSRQFCYVFFFFNKCRIPLSTIDPGGDGPTKGFFSQGPGTHPLHGHTPTRTPAHTCIGAASRGVHLEGGRTAAPYAPASRVMLSLSCLTVWPAQRLRTGRGTYFFSPFFLLHTAHEEE